MPRLRYATGWLGKKSPAALFADSSFVFGRQRRDFGGLHK